MVEELAAKTRIQNIVLAKSKDPNEVDRVLEFIRDNLHFQIINSSEQYQYSCEIPVTVSSKKILEKYKKVYCNEYNLFLDINFIVTIRKKPRFFRNKNSALNDVFLIRKFNKLELLISRIKKSFRPLLQKMLPYMPDLSFLKAHRK